MTFRDDIGDRIADEMVEVHLCSCCKRLCVKCPCRNEKGDLPRFDSRFQEPPNQEVPFIIGGGSQDSGMSLGYPAEKEIVNWFIPCRNAIGKGDVSNFHCHRLQFRSLLFRFKVLLRLLFQLFDLLNC